MAAKTKHKMRSAAEKKRIIKAVDKRRLNSKKGVEAVCKQFGVASSQYYGWKRKATGAVPRASKKGNIPKLISVTSGRGSAVNRGMKLSYTNDRDAAVIDFFLENHPEKVTITLDI